MEGSIIENRQPLCVLGIIDQIFLQAQAEVAKQQLQKINAEFADLEKKEAELKEKEVDVKHELQQCENVYKENAAKLKFHKDKVEFLNFIVVQNCLLSSPE